MAEYNPWNPLDLIQMPGALLRGALAHAPALAGQDTSQVPWLASGRELLESYGITGQNQEGLDWGDVAGFGVELLDPVPWMAGGAALKGGAALAKAGGAALAKQAVTGKLPWLAKAVGMQRPMMAATEGGLAGQGLKASADDAAKAASTWYHASNADPELLKTGLRASPGRAANEPTAAFFASTPEEAIRSTGKATSATRTSPWTIASNRTISQASDEYTQLAKAANAEAVEANKAVVRLAMGDKYNVDDAVNFLRDALPLDEPTHPANLLTSKLREAGYDAVHASVAGGSDSWMMALNPAIAKPAGMTAKEAMQIAETARATGNTPFLKAFKKIDAAKGGHNLVSLDDLKEAFPDWSDEAFLAMVKQARKEGIIGGAVEESLPKVQRARLKIYDTPDAMFPVTNLMLK